MIDPAVELYRKLLHAWNDRDAGAYSKLFSEDGSIVGFDGSTADSREGIKSHLEPIFADHPTAAYVGKVRAVRQLGAGTTLLRAVAGMVPPGKKVLMPERNAIQSLIVSRQSDGDWKIEMFQNTPARFDGRPDEASKLTRELEFEVERA
jgi:uncharacterized protein (TIGR02246 family)